MGANRGLQRGPTAYPGPAGILLRGLWGPTGNRLGDLRGPTEFLLGGQKLDGAYEGVGRTIQFRIDK